MNTTKIYILLIWTTLSLHLSYFKYNKKHKQRTMQIHQPFFILKMRVQLTTYFHTLFNITYTSPPLKKLSFPSNPIYNHIKWSPNPFLIVLILFLTRPHKVHIIPIKKVIILTNFFFENTLNNWCIIINQSTN
jgi:hypothetical protein